MQQKQIFDRIIIIGLGLIGGSLAKALRKARISNIIAAFDNDLEQLNFALSYDIIDQVYDFKDKIDDNDLVIMATPLSTYLDLAKKIAKNSDKNTIIIDVGSLKFFVEKDILPLFSDHNKNFVPCHPIAGSEKSGVKNSDGELFLGKKTIIIKSKKTDKNAIEKIITLWNEIGSQTQFLTAEEHDKIFALVSHFPQFLSFIAFNDKIKQDCEILKRHLRIQNSSPKIWSDIFKLNENNLKYYNKIYLKNLDQILDNFESKQYKKIFSFLKKVFDETTNFAFIYDFFPEKNQDLILQRIVLTSCFITIPDVINFRIYSGSGFRDFVIILSYLKYLLKDQQKAITIFDNSSDSLIKALKDIKQKINNYEFN